MKKMLNDGNIPKKVIFITILLGFILGSIPVNLAAIFIAALLVVSLILLNPFFGLIITAAIFTIDNIVLFDLVIPITPVKAIGLITAVSFFAHILLGKIKFRAPEQTNYMLGLIIVLSASTIFARPFPDRALTSLIKVLIIFAMFFFTATLINSFKRLETIIGITILSSGIIALIGIFSTNAYRWERFIGMDTDPNTVVLLMLPATIFGIYAILSQDEIKKKIIVALPVIPTLFAILLTFSRGGLIVLGACFAMLCYFQRKRKYSILSIILIFAMLAPFIPTSLGDRIFTLQELPSIIEGKSEGKDLSLYGRYGLVLTGLNMFFHNPLTGVGLTNFKYHAKDYNMPGFNTADAVAHNAYIVMLAETGIFGFVLFIAIILITFNQLDKIRKNIHEKDKTKLNLYKGLYVSFVGSLMICLFLDCQFERTPWFLMAIIAGFWGIIKKQNTFY